MAWELLQELCFINNTTWTVTSRGSNILLNDGYSTNDYTGDPTAYYQCDNPNFEFKGETDVTRTYNGLELKLQNQTLSVSLNGSTSAVSPVSFPTSAFRLASIIFVVDHSTQKALPVLADYDYSSTWGDWNFRSKWLYGINQTDLYNWLMDNPPKPPYNWQSVPSISGKNGILSCARVKDDSILTGDDITNIAMDGVITPSAANFPILFSGVPRGMRTPILYAGMVDHMDVQRTTGGPTAFNMYINVAGNDVYTWATGYFDNSYLGFIIDDENEVAKVVKINPYEQADIQVGWSMEVGPATDTEMHNIWLFIHSHTNEEDNPEINEGNPGTDPTYQPDIPVTGITKPGYGALDTGFTSMFRMSDTQLKQLSNFLWSSSFIDVVKKFFNDPREIIVGLSIMPVIPDTGSSTEVRAGGISTGVYGLPLTDQYKFDTYGYARVKAEKGNFLDYSPFTKVTAHLPFVGEHSLDVNDVVGKVLTLKYIFDFLTGSCVAEIDVDGNPRYFFGGACGIQIPTSSEDFGRMYSSILSAGATLGGTLSTIATGGLTAPLTFGAASSMLANGMNSSPTVQFSSGSGSVNGMIGCKTAFLVIEKPIEKIVGDQQKFLGRPSFTKLTLSACSGYTKCMQVHLDDIP